MTAPTPDLNAKTAALLLREHALRAKTVDDAKWFHDVANLIAAVTAERDQAARELAEQKRINASNLQVMTEQLDQARQMLADAPHEFPCMADLPQSPADYVCDCWKAGL
jgi:hypothetical protein